MPKPPRIFLGVTKRIDELDVPVTRVELEHGVSANLHMRSLLAEEFVPLHEEHEARLERGIRLPEWESMEYMEKVLIVAQRRVRLAVKNLQTEAELHEMDRKNRQVKPKRK